MSSGRKVVLFLPFLVVPSFQFVTSARAQVRPALASETVANRPVTVADAIEMTRVADTGYFLGDPANTHIAHFSPDGKQFVIILKKGNLEQNTNDFTILLFHADEALHSPKPEVLLKMASSSNRDAIANLKWLEDNERIVFLGEKPGTLPQVCTLNVKTKQLEEITNHPTEIRSYDVAADGHEILYVALPPKHRSSDTEEARRNGVVIEGQSLLDVLTEKYEPPTGEEVFMKSPKSAPSQVHINENFSVQESVSLSRDGRYGLISVGRHDIPATWSRYGGYIHQILGTSRPRGALLPVTQSLLFDVGNGTLSPLLDAPEVGWDPIWASDGRSVFLNTYLPLDGADTSATAEREKSFYPVEVKIPNRAFQKVTEDKWPKTGGSKTGLDVTIVQDLNTPQKIYISDANTHKKSLLLDLNPQFADLRFGKVEIIEWKVKNDLSLRGGLYLPPDYTPGKRYPLVIQTHGFGQQEEFSMDGLREWGSGYAARPLAAKGIIVLQGLGFASQADLDHYNDKNDFGSNPSEAGRNLNVMGIEALIHYLDQRGMVDTDRIGIVGFSRTVCFVGYLLTHSKMRFAAASLVDGIDCGYFEELAFPEIAWDLNDLNGGVPPVGAGLEKWLNESPGFNLDKVRTPVRLLALGPSAVLEMWDWYAGLSLQKKPVDFILLPGATHFTVKPWERRVAQEGLVDWFCFWLKGEEDSNPAKAEQYARWHQLRVG